MRESLLSHRIVLCRMLSLTTGSNDLCLDAITIALLQTGERDPWYTSTKHLQLVSLRVCVACRKVATLHLRVDNRTPHHLYIPPEHMSGWKFLARWKLSCPWVPSLRPLGVTWHGPADALALEDNALLADVETFVLAHEWPCGAVERVVWPRRITEIDFGAAFDHTVDAVIWPPGVQHLKFGEAFNQRIDDVKWPESLERLTLGECNEVGEAK